MGEQHVLRHGADLADIKFGGGMRVEQAKRRKALEVENARRKRAVADLTVDKQILAEVVEGKWLLRVLQRPLAG